MALEGGGASTAELKKYSSSSSSSLICLEVSLFLEFDSSVGLSRPLLILVGLGVIFFFLLGTWQLPSDSESTSVEEMMAVLLSFLRTPVADQAWISICFLLRLIDDNAEKTDSHSAAPGLEVPEPQGQAEV